MKILVVVSGSIKRHLEFVDAGKKLGVDVEVASLSKVNYTIENSLLDVYIGKTKVSNYNLIYFRVIGSAQEQMSVLLEYARENKVKVVDSIYEDCKYLQIPLKKSVENQLLAKDDIPIPNTYFGNLKKILTYAPHVIGFPMVVKSTSGRRGKDVWIVGDHDELEELISTKLTKKESNFIAQEMLDGNYRVRVLVVGGKAIGAISRPTKFARKNDFGGSSQITSDSENSQYLIEKFGSLAVKAATSLHLDIAGVDIITNQRKPFVIEVNQSPRWDSIKKDLKISPELEIVEFLKKSAHRSLVHHY